MVLLTAIFTSVSAQVPRTLSYQGVLTDTAGIPKPDGNYTITFAIYNVSSGGTALWSTSKSLAIKQGLFSTSLNVSDTLQFKTQYYLGIKVGVDPEMTPRIALATSGAAIRAIKADTADYVNGAGITNINASNITTGTLRGSLLDSIDAGKIRTGLLAPIRIGRGISGDSITVGTINDARLDTVIDRVRFNASGNITALRGVHVGSLTDPGIGRLQVDSMVGIGAGPILGAALNLYTSNNALTTNGINLMQNYTGTSNKFGIYMDVSASGTGGRYGMYNVTRGNTSGSLTYGLVNVLMLQPTSGTAYGIYNTGEDYNYFSGKVGIGEDIPTSMLHVAGDAYIKDNLGVGAAPLLYAAGYVNTNTTSQYMGMNVEQNYTGTSSKYGYYCNLDSTGTGIKYGMRSDVAANPAVNSPVYGLYTQLYHKGSIANIYGCRISISSPYGDGTRFGIYASGDSLNYLSGQLGLGTTTPGIYKLYVNGSAIATSWNLISDLHFKKDIRPIIGALDKVEKMQGVFYNWKTEEYADRGFDKTQQVGFIAQDVEKVMPELVKTDADGYKSLSYDKITAVLVEAIKEQQKTISELQTASAAKTGELKTTKDELQKTKAELQLLKSRMEQIEVALKKLEQNGAKRVSLKE